MWNQHNITLKRDGAKARRPLVSRDRYAKHFEAVLNSENPNFNGEVT